MAYCKSAYRETLRIQIYLADNNISMEYTDKLSLAELDFLFNTTKDYLEEKYKDLPKLPNQST